MMWTICACIVGENQVELDSEVSKYLMETMWLRLGSLTSKETVLSFISLRPNKHSRKVELEIVRLTFVESNRVKQPPSASVVYLKRRKIRGLYLLRQSNVKTLV